MLKFPASEAYERVPILLLVRKSQAQYWMLVAKKMVSISHASQEEILNIALITDFDMIQKLVLSHTLDFAHPY